MQTKFTQQKTHSCAQAVHYLEKENDLKIGGEKEYFFSADRDKCNKWEVIQQIDNNGKDQGLGKDQDRYFSIVIAPSQEELAHIGHDKEKLKEFTRDVMEKYAENFGKGLESKNLVWYAKIEEERKYSFKDDEVKPTIDEKGNKIKSTIEIGDIKPGDNRHIHVLVSRCTARENAHVLQEKTAKKENNRTMKINPLTNHKGASKGVIKSGFHRSNFYQSNEKIFDQKFDYKRDLEKSYEYCNGLKNGHKESYDRAMGANKGLEATNAPGKDKSINKAAGLSTGY